MGEPAKAFWVEEQREEAVETPFEDVAAIATGEPDEAWRFGSD